MEGIFVHITDEFGLPPDMFDFSKESEDFRKNLWIRLSKTVLEPQAYELSDDELDFVNAAGSVEMTRTKDKTEE